MSDITYVNSIAGSQKVYLDGEHVGAIQPIEGGWQYLPRGTKPNPEGEVYPTLEDCKQTLTVDKL